MKLLFITTGLSAILFYSVKANFKKHSTTLLHTISLIHTNKQLDTNSFSQNWDMKFSF
jgi:hypothetical protein